MKKSRINPVSKPQAILNAEWKKIGDEEAERLHYICQWCHRPCQRSDNDRLDHLDAHHIEKRSRYNYTKENCFMVCRQCHDIIGHKIDVREITSKEEYLRRLE